ncbi:MAG: hypothetical protein GC192_23505 [Bacteroidetes bacterium]|nr:hypothetical protein [Bacteroidota bacterium]
MKENSGGRNQLTIREAIKRLAGSGKSKWLFEATVQSVSEKTCVVFIDDLNVEDEVLLNAPGEGAICRFYPEEKSTVVVAIMEDVSYLVAVSTISKALIGGDKYGVIRAEDLIDQISKTNSVVQKLISVLTTPPTVAGGDGGATAFSNVATSLAGQSVGDFSNLINDKLRHGN